MGKVSATKQFETLRQVLDKVSEMIIWLNADGKCCLCNLAACENLQYSFDELNGLALKKIELQGKEHDWSKIWNKLQRNPKWFSDSWFKRKDGSIFPVGIDAHMIEYQDVEYIYAIISDITRSSKIEEAFFRNLEKYYKFFNNVPSAVFLSSIDDGRFVEVNEAFETVSGYSLNEVIGKTVDELDLYVDNTLWQSVKESAERSGRIETIEMEFRRKDKELRIGQVTAETIDLEEEKLLIGVISDITERKHAERAVNEYQENLRSLSSELINVESSEKRKIAEYLHDYLGQSLALAKIKVGSLQRADLSSQTNERLIEIEKDLTDAINYSQSVIYELSPPVLYELGLMEALKWKLDDFEKKQGIRTQINSPLPEINLDQVKSNLLFRTTVELLNNIVKHAQATEVILRVVLDENKIILTVSDNGVGFDPDTVSKFNAEKNQFGIFSIKERMRYYGGGMQIRSDPSNGTDVSVFLPIQSD